MGVVVMDGAGILAERMPGSWGDDCPGTDASTDDRTATATVQRAG